MKIPNRFGQKYTDDFEAIYTDLAKEWSIPLLPFLLEGVAFNPALTLPDGLHPNAKGQQVMAQTVMKHLKPFLEQRID